MAATTKSGKIVARTAIRKQFDVLRSIIFIFAGQSGMKLIMPKPTTLALDLEGTLISNAVSQIPRPGLRCFLDSCEPLFERIVIYTAVNETRFREIARTLCEANFAPEWFQFLEYINWDKKTKDLARITSARPDEILLIDDLAEYVHPGQASQWIKISQFEAPYSDKDGALCDVLTVLNQRINGH